MKRYIPLALAVACAPALADKKPMEHVLVSVPIHKKTAQTALPVTVLTGDELRRQAASSIGETLANQPGIASASFGPGVGQPVIRGQQGPRVQVLQNGTSSADVASLSPDHAVNVEALLADSIEVLRGPSTLLYGGGAIGGVVNVIDNRIPTSRIEGVTGTAEYRYADASEMKTGVGRIDAGSGNFALHLDAMKRDYDDLEIPDEAIDLSSVDDPDEVENTDGFIANTDGDAESYSIGASYHFADKGFVGLSYNRMESNYGIPPGAHEHEHEEDGEDAAEEEEEELIRLDMNQDRYDAALHVHDPLPGIEVVRGFLTYTDYNHVELEGVETGTEFNRDTWESRLEVVHQDFGGWHGVLGLQWRSDEFSALGEEAYVPETDSVDVGLFLVEDYHRGDWIFEGGLRVDWADRDPDAVRAGSTDFTANSASASALWNFSPGWNAGLAVARSERAPVTQELYSNVDAIDPSELVVHAATRTIEVGNPDLDTEVSVNTDLSLNWTSGRVDATLTLFYNDFSDYIYLANSGAAVGEDPILLYTQDDAEFYGVELETTVALGQMLDGDISLSLFGDSIHGELDEGGDVPRLPPARIGAGLNWQGESMRAWIDVLSAADQDDPGDNELPTDGYTRWDAGADYQLALGDRMAMTLFARLKNIGDEDIRQSTSFLRDVAPEAGRSIEAGIRVEF